MTNVKITKVEIDTELIPMLSEFEQLIDEITLRAYQLFEKRGREHGLDVDDWLLAEAEILGAPAAKMTESESDFKVAIALNGFKPSDIAVIAGRTDTIIRVKNRLGDGRPSIKMMRHIRYPERVEIATVRAFFANGILTIAAAKANGAKTDFAVDALTPPRL